MYSKIFQSPDYIFKSALLVFLFLYPLIIYPIQSNVYMALKYIWNRIYKNVFFQKIGKLISLLYKYIIMKKEQTYEAFSLDNTKLNVYSDMNTNLQTNIDFINCIDNNNKDCEKNKITYRRRKQQINRKRKNIKCFKDKRNKAQITYTECENKIKIL